MKIDFTPIDDRVLIKAEPLLKIEKDIKFQERSMTDPNMILDKTRKGMVEMGVRKAVILALPINWNTEATGIKEGDTVVVEARAVEDFDLIKGTAMVRKFNILGIWTK